MSATASIAYAQQKQPYRDADGAVQRESEDAETKWVRVALRRDEPQRKTEVEVADCWAIAVDGALPVEQKRQNAYEDSEEPKAEARRRGFEQHGDSDDGDKRHRAEY